MAAIDAIVGRRDERALFAFLATSPGPAPQALVLQTLVPQTHVPQAHAPQALVPQAHAPQPHVHQPQRVTLRIVTDTLGSRGKTERLVCRSDGDMRMMRLLDRETSDTNKLFLKAKRGEVLEVSPLPANDRIAPNATVTRLQHGGES